MTTFHPIQTNLPKQNHVPEAVALRAYEVYVNLYGEQPAMIDVEHGCRGGFSVSEVIAFLYAHTFPKEEWQIRFEEALERPS